MNASYRTATGPAYTAAPVLIVIGPAWSEAGRRKPSDTERKHKAKLRAVAKASKKRNR